MGSVRFSLFAIAVVAAVAMAAPGFASAQHETTADIEDGGRVFRDSCANCHGPDGDELAGVDLGRGQFRRASSDADLIRIIREGIPGTPMPATNFSAEQAARVVSYLRFLTASRTSVAGAGNAARGQAIFEGKAGCMACHGVNGQGSRLGPELSRIGQMRRAIELEQSLLDPEAEVLPSNRFYRVVGRDGAVTTGRLLNLDTFTIQLLDTSERLRSFAKADLREHGFAPSPMPSFRNTLTREELADVVSYLVSLKGTP